MSIDVRPAVPEDSRFLAHVILMASRSQLERGPFEIAFRLPEEEILDILEWMTLSDLVTNCHYSKFVVAEQAGEFVGALSVHDPGDSDILPLGAALADALSGLGYDDDELLSSAERLQVLRKCVPSPQPGTWVVEWVGVEQPYRRRGAAKQLLHEGLAAGARRAIARTQVSTYLDNHSAIQAYSKAGFRLERETRDAEFATLLGVPGMVTMTRQLV